MNIPLDRLYNYINNLAEKIYGSCVVIYRFWPHGSKNIENLECLKFTTFLQTATSPIIYCHDQEPLMFDYYSKYVRSRSHQPFYRLSDSMGMAIKPTNFNHHATMFEKNILLHSEKNSAEVKKYQDQNQLLMVYYWSHAVIARDWFRFAEHVEFKKQNAKLFLIYNRSWTGTREYRMKFADLLVESDLVKHCKTWFNAHDADTDLHYGDHVFRREDFRPKHQLEKYLCPSTVSATSSADFDIDDYNCTQLEVVLETLFDDCRWHLTEKILRPIACGQPFILAGTAGSLQYIKHYGFKTFDAVWSEDYDTILDPNDRLHAIIDLMHGLANLDHQQRTRVIQQAQEIANFNRRWFFSREFFDMIINELESNLVLALNDMKNTPGNQDFIDRWQKMLSNELTRNLLATSTDAPLSLPEAEQMLLLAKNKLHLSQHLDDQNLFGLTDT